MKQLSLPLSLADKKSLVCGEKVLISGVVYSARDLAHARLVALIEAGESLPFNLENSTIFYVGPTQFLPGNLPKAVGPTTSSRMDPFTPKLLEAGVSCLIGKGERSIEVAKSMHQHQAIYLVGIGGVGALLAKSILQIELVAYPELGPEAIYKMEVKDMPLYVGLDLSGGDIYQR